jgi:formamidopyrimidine-DNA glycosylase
MPELPEVETVVQQLRPLVQGQTIVSLRVLDPRLGRLPGARLRQRRVSTVTRIGKQVALALEPRTGRSLQRRGADPGWIGIHLRMTGRLIWLPDERSREPEHVRARITLGRGKLVFADLRRFGTIAIGARRIELEPAGVDPLSDQFTCERLAQLLRGSAQPLKVWLLRQDRLVGLGNIYACEILFGAGLDPRRVAGRLRVGEIERLHEVTRAVLLEAIDNCGTTFSDFQDAHGVTGSYQRYLKVYGREGLACPSCQAPVRRIVQQQRSTFFCGSCQARSRR